MTKIEKGRPCQTLINVFQVAPERADELLALLIAATEETMRGLPGFISANLHVSGDRARIANYAQWRSEEDFRAMLANPEAQRHMKQAADIADSIDPVLYTVAYVDAVEDER